MSFFRRRDDPHTLAVSMTGVKMGDRFLQIDSPNGGRLAALAAKVGLSGRAVAIVPNEDTAARARKAAANAGVLIEVEVGSITALGIEESAFDLALVDDTAGSFGSMEPATRAALVRELLRVLRPGGRLMVIGATAAGGVKAILSRQTSDATFDAAPFLLAEGFRAVRTLAEREGLVFVEGIKPKV